MVEVFEQTGTITVLETFIYGTAVTATRKHRFGKRQASRNRCFYLRSTKNL